MCDCKKVTKVSLTEWVIIAIVFLILATILPMPGVLP